MDISSFGPLEGTQLHIDTKKACFKYFARINGRKNNLYTCGFYALLSYSCIFIIMASYKLHAHNMSTAEPAKEKKLTE